jgi:hypothetical protein
MWCVNCQADVAAEVSPDDGRVQCAVCSTELARARGMGDQTRNAREILERWSKTDFSDPFGPLPAIKKPERIMDSRPPKNIDDRLEKPIAGPDPEVDAGAEEFEQLTADKPLTPRSKSKFRIDAAVPPGAINSGMESARPRTHRRPRQLAFDESHGRDVSPPHFQYTLREPEQKDNFSVTVGQWLAYLGVLGLTIGTAIVVYGHFGGLSNYTPTGWLVTTVGQMLLFLGVINLVSGGMEQSNDEVSQRIEMLGEHILRIEQATDHALRGPKIPAAAYDGEEVVSDQSRVPQDQYLSE